VAVGLDIARHQQEAYGWNARGGVSQQWAGRKEEPTPAPRLGGVGGHDWRRWWAVVGEAGIRGFWLNDWGFGADSSRKTDYPLSVSRDIAICEQNRGLGRFYVHPAHQTLHKTCVPVFFQQPQAGFRMVYERVCRWVGKDESIKAGDIVQTATASSQVSNILIVCMRGERQAAVRAIGGWVKDGNTTAIINSAFSYLRRKYAHFPAQELRDGGCDIERERREGHDEMLRRSRDEAAELIDDRKKAIFFLQSWKECFGSRAQLGKQRGSKLQSI
jgi:hypothetical protein